MAVREREFDVYLSYRQNDRDVVAELQRHMETLGLRVWRDLLGTARQTSEAALPTAMASVRAALFCVGPTGPSPHLEMELSAATARAQTDRDFIFTAALLPGLPDDFSAASLPIQLRERQWLDLRSGFSELGRFLDVLPRADTRAGGEPVRSPSVEHAASRLSGEVTAAALVAELLALHPEFGERRGGDVELDREHGRRASTDGWLEAVRGLLSDPGTELHGRLVIVGLARLDDDLRAQLERGGLLAAVEREIREPPDSLFAAQPPPPEETVPTYTDNPARRDELNREGVARILARRLRDTHETEEVTAAADGEAASGRSFLVHVHGPWGVGKTSLLNMLRAELHKPDGDRPPWVVVTFNAWQHQRLAPPWWWLMTALYRQGGAELWRFSPRRALWFRAREWLWRLRGGWPGLVALLAGAAVLVAILRAGYFDALGSGDNASGGTIKALAAGLAALLAPLVAIWGVARSAGRWLLTTSARGARVYMQHANDPLQTMKDHFAQLVRWLRPHPLAIVIDDLDRCQPAFAVECLEGIQTLFRDVPVAYVIAADREWLAGSYASEYASFTETFDEPGRPLGYLFLEKTFQVTVPIPAMSAETRDAYWRHLIRPGTDIDDRAALETAREQAAGDFAELESEEAIRTELARDPGATEVEQRARREAAAIQLASPKLEQAAEHVLHPFRPLLDPNPRAMKRLVNAYGLARGVQLLGPLGLGGDKPAQQRTALWTILNLRWPRLAEYLAAHPDSAAAFGSDGAAPGGLAEDLLPLFSDPEVIDVVRGRAEGVDATLDPDSIRLCVTA